MENINPEKVRDYINENFADVVSTIHIIPKDKNKYFEGPTLDEIYRFSCENDGYKVLYFHSKGISKTLPGSGYDFSEQYFPWINIYQRRNSAQDYCIVNHMKRLKELDTYDIVGPYFELAPVPQFDVNFWWATTAHIRKLQPPLDKSRYCSEIQYDTLGKLSEWRYKRAEKKKAFILKTWNRAACAFWICNNTVLPDGTILSTLPKIKVKDVFNNIKELIFYVLDWPWRNHIRKHLYEK